MPVTALVVVVLQAVVAVELEVLVNRARRRSAPRRSARGKRFGRGGACEREVLDTALGVVVLQAVVAV